MYTPQKTWLPTTPKGLGQAICPSLEQLQGITDLSDPCQQTGTSFSASGVETCYNNATGVTIPCPLAGTTQTGPPSANGPFGMPAITNLNWGVLAAVLGGLVLLAAVSGGKH